MTAAASAFSRTQLSEDQARVRVLDAVKELAKAPFTVVDVVARSGLPPHEVESALAKVVRDYRSDIDVDEQGNLLYRVDPAMVAREDIVKADASRRRKAAFKQGLISFFKGWTLAMVVVFFVIYVILLVAFLVAISSRKNSSSSSSSSRSSGPSFGGNWLNFGWATSGGYGGQSSWSSQRDRRRWNNQVEAELREGKDPYQLDKKESRKKPGLRDRTWFHLFGTEGIRRNPLEAEKELLTYIRAKKGFITNADIVALLGVTYDQADSVGTRLVATYEGELDLTDEGLAIYRFPNLMLTGAPEVQQQSAQLDYLWQVRSKEHALRSNPSRVIPALNLVNIVLGLFTGFVILPFFQMDSAGAQIGLVYFPMLFSLIFLGLGLRRAMCDRLGKADYERQSMRLAVFRLLFVRKTAVRIPGDERALQAAGFGSWTTEQLRAVLPTIAADLRGELNDELSELRAPRVWAEMAAVERVRASADSRRRVGRTVYSTRDANSEGEDSDGGGKAQREEAKRAEGDGLGAEIASLEKELQG